MSGRIYRLRRVCGNRACGNLVNRFTIDDYNAAAQSIDKVALYNGQGYGIKVSTDTKQSLITVRSILEKLWKFNGDIKPKSHYTFDTVAHTELYKFGVGRENKALRDKAYQIAQKFAFPDAIYEDVHADRAGNVVTKENLKITVDMEQNPDDPNEMNMRRGTSRQNQNDDEGTGTGTGSSWTTWALIGGGVLLLVIVVAMFLKKK